MAYCASKKVSGKPTKVRLDPTVNWNEPLCAPQVPDKRVRPAVSLRRMEPYDTTRIDSDFPTYPSSAAQALHSQTGIPSFIVGQFKWQQLNTNGYGKFYGGKIVAVYLQTKFMEMVRYL